MQAFFEGYTLLFVLKLILRIAIYTTKTLWSELRTAATNFLFFISLTLLIVIIYDVKPLL